MGDVTHWVYKNAYFYFHPLIFDVRELSMGIIFRCLLLTLQHVQEPLAPRQIWVMFRILHLNLH